MYPQNTLKSDKKIKLELLARDSTWWSPVLVSLEQPGEYDWSSAVSPAACGKI